MIGVQKYASSLTAPYQLQTSEKSTIKITKKNHNSHMKYPKLFRDFKLLLS